MRKIAERSDNFIDRCKNISIGDESCIMGIVTLSISFIPLALFIYAFIKMTLFYKKINFENFIILISGIETIIIEFALTTSLDFFLQLFFFLQILSISLLINKFSQLIKDMKSIFKKKYFFVLVNAINSAIFISYIVYMIIPNDYSFFLNLLYKLFYLITTCLLSYFCIFLNKLISKHKEENIESYNINFDLNILNIDNDDDESDTEMTINDKKNHGSNRETTNSNSEASNSDNKSNNINEENIKKRKKEEIFYNIKKKQNKCLYIVNLSCSIIEFFFTLVRFFIIHEDFSENKFKIIPLTITTEIIYYIYLLICLVNVSAIFFCFYFFIRRTYSINPKVFKKRPSKILIDDDFVEEQKKIEQNENNNNIISERNVRRKISEQNFYFPELSMGNNNKDKNNNNDNNK